MNADDRNPNHGGQPPVSPPSAQEPVRRAGMMPPSGTVPQRTAFRPVTGTQPTGAQPTGAQPVAPRPAGTPSTGTPPATSPQSTSTPVRTDSFSPQGTSAPAAGYQTAPGVQGAAPATTAVPDAASPAGVGASSDKPRTATAGLGRVSTGAKEKAAVQDSAQSTAANPGAPRKVRVLLSRIDPWSALKIGFLLAIAAGIMLVVAAHVLWTALNSMGTFELIQQWVSKLFTKDQEVNILQFVDYNKVISASLLVSVTNVVLISGLSVISAFLYNMVSRMVGGIYVTLTDD